MSDENLQEPGNQHGPGSSDALTQPGSEASISDRKAGLSRINFWVGLALWAGVFVALFLTWRNRAEADRTAANQNQQALLVQKDGEGDGKDGRPGQTSSDSQNEESQDNAEREDSPADALAKRKVVDAKTPTLEVTWSENGLSNFSFTDRSGEKISKNDLLGQPWVASFIFTTCAGPCARVSGAMQQLHREYEGQDVRFVSFTVNPKTDTPEVLARYADFYEADADRWFFLTGDRGDLYSLIQRDFLMPVGESPDPEPGWEVIHTTKVCLVDSTGRVIGAYLSTKDEELNKLKRDLNRLLNGRKAPAESRREAPEDDGSTPTALALPSWMKLLPTVNASLNGLSTVLLIAGLLLIRRGHRDTHRNVMLTAFGVSVLFLVCYGVYHLGLHHYTGTHGRSFSGTGPARVIYLAILISHVVLAAVVPVLAVLTILRGLKANWEKHRRIARITFPIWLYVSITGVVIYLMLYHWPLDEPTV